MSTIPFFYLSNNEVLLRYVILAENKHSVLLTVLSENLLKSLDRVSHPRNQFLL